MPRLLAVLHRDCDDDGGDINCHGRSDNRFAVAAKTHRIYERRRKIRSEKRKLHASFSRQVTDAKKHELRTKNFKNVHFGPRIRELLPKGSYETPTVKLPTN